MHNKDFEGDSAHKPWGISFGEMMAIKIETLRKYKFFLVSLLCLFDCFDGHNNPLSTKKQAFENNNVTDYVTEKLPSSLIAGAVPVYMGSETGL